MRLRRYPPLDATTWTDAALDDLVHGFLAERDGPARIMRLWMSVREERDFELVVERMLKNHLADRGRRTEAGKLHRRLRHVMSQDERFRSVGGDSWTVIDIGLAPVERGQDLRTAARAAVREAAGRAGRARTDRLRFPDRASLAAICEAVIQAAGEPVSLRTMTSLLVPLLCVADASPQLLTGDVPRGVALAAGALPSPGPARSIATDIWNRLDDRERLLLPYLTDPVRRVGEVIGTGHSQAAVAAGRLRGRLRFLLAGEDELSQQEIIGYLLDVQAQWARRARGTADPASAG